VEEEGILDEFCANGDYHRMHAIRLRNGPASSGGPLGKDDGRSARAVDFKGGLASG